MAKKTILMTLLIILCLIILVSCGDKAAQKANDKRDGIWPGTEWTSESYPQPENCQLLGKCALINGTQYIVTWSSQESAVAYIGVLGNMGEGDGKPTYYDRMTLLYDTDQIHLAYSSEEGTLSNILIYDH